jgi:hypothetical protein
MKTNISEFPKHPLPHMPPPDTQCPCVQPPTVFVYLKQSWEYKVVSKNTADEPPLTENELNALGRDSWELVGMVPIAASNVQFFFKRVRS